MSLYTHILINHKISIETMANSDSVENMNSADSIKCMIDGLTQFTILLIDQVLEKKPGLDQFRVLKELADINPSLIEDEIFLGMYIRAIQIKRKKYEKNCNFISAK